MFLKFYVWLSLMQKKSQKLNKCFCGVIAQRISEVKHGYIWTIVFFHLNKTTKHQVQFGADFTNSTQLRQLYLQSTESVCFPA